MENNGQTIRSQNTSKSQDERVLENVGCLGVGISFLFPLIGILYY